MGSWVRIRLLHIFHFVMDFLFPLLKNSKTGVDDRCHRFRSGSPLTSYPHAAPRRPREGGHIQISIQLRAIDVKGRLNSLGRESF